MSLMNVAEDLSGLSRAELVYKAKLAEQAERCVRARSFPFRLFTVRSRRGRRTEKNLSLVSPGSGHPRIGSGFGETERSTAVARDDPRGFREPVSGGASDRSPRALRRPGSRARSHGFFARREHRQLEPRRELERGARGRRPGARAGLARGNPARGLAAATKPRPAAARHRVPPHLLRYREAAPPRGPLGPGATQRTSQRANQTETACSASASAASLRVFFLSSIRRRPATNLGPDPCPPLSSRSPRLDRSARSTTRLHTAFS